jgi:hypothetical protein
MKTNAPTTGTCARFWRVRSVAPLLMASLLALALAGCPPDPGPGNPQAEYDLGFADGFAEDEEYWMGYDDSWDTRDGGTIFYTGDEIPFVDGLNYEAGYWDGVWFAYHDGYFVAYDYAFTIGFSEGYDVGFQANWVAVLSADEHVEWLDGGFSDGYNDGFSEGIVMGAFDFREGFPYDWFDAMWWYREGNDVFLPEVGFGTGEIILFEYGTNPFDLLKSTETNARLERSDRPVPSIRQDSAAQAKQANGVSYRSLAPSVQQQLQVQPQQALRDDHPLGLDSTWLQRVQQYLNSLN